MRLSRTVMAIEPANSNLVQSYRPGAFVHV